MSKTVLIHASTVAIDGHGVLLRGPSGIGKSDLALRLIDAGARLVSDDQSEVCRSGDRLIVRAPAAIRGLIEVRGIGIIRVDALTEAPLALVVDLVAAEAVERLPTRRSEPIFGLSIPLIQLAPLEPSAAAKLRLALRAFTGSGPPAIISK